VTQRAERSDSDCAGLAGERNQPSVKTNRDQSRVQENGQGR
jgi:hypothetical protein